MNSPIVALCFQTSSSRTPSIRTFSDVRTAVVRLVSADQAGESINSNPGIANRIGLQNCIFVITPETWILN